MTNLPTDTFWILEIPCKVENPRFRRTLDAHKRWIDAIFSKHQADSDFATWLDLIWGRVEGDLKLIAHGAYGDWLQAHYQQGYTPDYVAQRLREIRGDF